MAQVSSYDLQLSSQLKECNLSINRQLYFGSSFTSVKNLNTYN